MPRRKFRPPAEPKIGADPDLIPADPPFSRGGHRPPLPAPPPVGGFPPTQDHAPRDAGPVIAVVDDPDPDIDQSARAADRARTALALLVERRREALRLYEPLDVQRRFHESPAAIRLVVGGNRGGKTTPAAVEVARAVTGQDPYNKWPKENGIFICVGKDGSHLGKVMYPRLFLKRKANFKMVRDAETGRWRAYRPWDAADQARAREAQLSGPLVPARFVKEISWYSKKDLIPRVVRLHNGWEVYFYSSESDPPGGYAADGAWFDEEIVRGAEWLSEVQARLVDHQGKLIWSATPQHATEQLYELHQQALEEAGKPDRVAAEFLVHIDNNAYITEAARAAFKATMKRRGEEAYQVRVDGLFAIEGYRVYPEYGDGHLVEPFEIPEDWAVYLVIDPGRQVCGVLFVAVPPPSDKAHAKHVYFYDELYIRDSDARKFARGVAEKLCGRVAEAFLMDEHEGRKHETGSGRTIKEQYARALKRQGVRSHATGHGFWPTPDTPRPNREALRDWLTPDEYDVVKLVVFSRCENFHREMKNYHYKKVAGIRTDEPEKKNDHLCDCAGYAAKLELPWRKPASKAQEAGSKIVQALAKRRRQRGQRASDRRYVNMGPRG